MQSSRRGATRINGVVAGSVWDSRMRIDKVKGGVKVFNADDSTAATAAVPPAVSPIKRLSRNQSDFAATEKGKRRNCKPPPPPGEADRSPTQLRKTLSVPAKHVVAAPTPDENCRELAEEKAMVVRQSNAEEISVNDGRGEDGDIEVVEVEDGEDDEEEDEAFDDKQVDLVEEKLEEEGEEKTAQIYEAVVPISSEAGEKQLPQEAGPIFVKSPPKEVDDDDVYECMPESQNRMQDIVDLVMWRDISRSAFVFGIGAFLLVSSSYTKDLDFSLISGISYLGLFYLAAIFIYKSILHRGEVHFEERGQRWLVGEEEAIWVIKMVLPYMNEILMKLRALFSGDPATTMKMAMALFALARCGGSVTIWTMAKMAFFGAFTIPRICTSYSTQISRYGKFWLERCRDAWDSCTHKKAAAVAAFTVVWNLSSTVARIWAVFMLAVVVRYYQQCVASSDWDEDSNVEAEDEQQPQQQQRPQRQGAGEGRRLPPEPSRGRRVVVPPGGVGGVRPRQRLGPSRLEAVGIIKEKKTM